MKFELYDFLKDLINLRFEWTVPSTTQQFRIRLCQKIDKGEFVFERNTIKYDLSFFIHYIICAKPFDERLIPNSKIFRVFRHVPLILHIYVESQKKNGIKYVTTPTLVEIIIHFYQTYGGRLGEGYEILAKDYKNRRQNGCCEGKCDWKGRISVPQDKSLNLYNIECHGNHDPDHV
ncbi:hypothetical protein C2G38_2037570 [Gigaspora rosea]|uniref:Uncharacterized protein n=1 Tax=Gigaspora rosea TaxID=44941 RepID=A0A397V5D9_9GLOM|nr:hypothetical protein C2G38_2037570 [Gigaspora rosea]